MCQWPVAAASLSLSRTRLGYDACSALIRSSESTDAETVTGSLLEAGEHAQESVNEDIRAAAEDLGIAGAVVAHPEKMRTACADHGIDVPEPQEG